MEILFKDKNQLIMRLTDNFFIIEHYGDTENGFYVELHTNPKHYIYTAHFPGNPITPGVCIIQAAGELLEIKLNRKLYLKNVKSAKFLKVIIPKEDKIIRYSFSNIIEDDNSIKTQVVVYDNADICAKISMIFSKIRL